MKIDPKGKKMQCSRCGVPMERKESVNTNEVFYTCKNDRSHCEIREKREEFISPKAIRYSQI